MGRRKFIELKGKLQSNFRYVFLLLFLFTLNCNKICLVMIQYYFYHDSWSMSHLRSCQGSQPMNQSHFIYTFPSILPLNASLGKNRQIFNKSLLQSLIRIREIAKGFYEMKIKLIGVTFLTHLYLFGVTICNGKYSQG